MTIGKESESREETSEEISRDVTLSAAGSSAGSSLQNEDSLSTGSCSAILEPSEDEPLLYKREKIRKPYKKYKTAIMQSYNSTEINVNSEEPSIEENVQRTSRIRSICLNLWNRYSELAIKFRNSSLIYFVQMQLLLLPISALWMGIKYTDGCPGASGLPVLTSLTGILGFMLIGQWIVIKYCGPEDRPCEGQQKFFILLFFILVAALLEFEICIFCKMSPSFEPSSSNYCSKVFYDYTYYKFITAFGSMFQVVLLYFPDYWSFASGIECSDPVAATCYRAAMEEST